MFCRSVGWVGGLVVVAMGLACGGATSPKPPLIPPTREVIRPAPTAVAPVVAEPMPTPAPSMGDLPPLSEDVLPIGERSPGKHAVISEYLRWQVPPEGLTRVVRDGGDAWQWQDEGLFAGELSVTAWARSEPTSLSQDGWVAARREAWAAAGHEVVATDTGMTFAAGELTESPRIQVMTETHLQLHLLDVRDGVGIDWTCEVPRANMADLPLSCMFVGVSVHLIPPPLPDLSPVPDAQGAAPLMSIERDKWPCGATTDDGDLVQYTYGDVDQCTLDPNLFVVGCPTQILRVWTSEGAPYKVEQDLLTYVGNRLTGRTSRAAPMGTDSALRSRVRPLGSSYVFDYNEGRLSEVSITRAGEQSPYKTLDVTYPSETEMVVDPNGSPVTYGRLPDGRQSSKTGGLGGRAVSYKADGRPDWMEYRMGETPIGRLTYVYECTVTLEFPE